MSNLKLPKYILLILLLFYGSCLLSQTEKEWSFQYRTILLDSTYAADKDPKIQKYILQLQHRMTGILNHVIGYAPSEMTSYAPASPLSNFLTDNLLEYGSGFCLMKEGMPADFSLLNFGGIRNIIPAGKVTINTIYKVLPFENKVAIILLKGSEVKKIFKRFTAKANQPYSGVQIIYRNEKPFKILIHNNEIDNNKIYRMVTVDFIETGGDQILKDISFEKVIYTYELFRDVIIQQIRNISDKGENITGKTDERVVIEYQN